MLWRTRLCRRATVSAAAGDNRETTFATSMGVFVRFELPCQRDSGPETGALVVPKFRRPEISIEDISRRRQRRHWSASRSHAAPRRSRGHRYDEIQEEGGCDAFRRSEVGSRRRFRRRGARVGSDGGGAGSDNQPADRSRGYPSTSSHFAMENSPTHRCPGARREDVDGLFLQHHQLAHMILDSGCVHIQGLPPRASPVAGDRQERSR